MNPIGKFRRSWLLFTSSLSVIFRNRQLLVFPIVIFSLTALIVLFFLAPPLLRPTGFSYASADHWQAIYHSLFKHTSRGMGTQNHQIGFTPAAIVYLAFLYLVTMFVATFLNVAFYHEILAALTGEQVSLGRGLKFAATRLKAILMWTLFAGAVGLIIKAIEERAGAVGRITARLIGAAWSVAAVFVIPIIVCDQENANPVKALRKSATMLKRTWGEALIGYAGLTAANSFIVIGSMLLLGGVLMASAALRNFWLIGITAAVWFVAMFVWGYITSVASQVYKGALFLYAADGVVPEPYSREMLDMAWKFEQEPKDDGGKIKLS
jgi:hypothetical protein